MDSEGSDLCDASKGGQLVAVETALLALCLLLVALRLFVRGRINKNLGLDDLCIVLSLIFIIIVYVLGILSVSRGLGKHSVCVGFSSIVNIRKETTLSEFFITIALLFSRVSICIFVLRLFGITTLWIVILYGLMIFIIITNVVSAATILPACNPTEKLWNSDIPGTCWPLEVLLKIGYYNGAASVISDLFLTAVPIYFLWNVQMATRVKGGLAIAMSLGLGTAACALARTIYTARTPTDFIWEGIPYILRSVLEGQISIIAACVPTLKPLINRVRDNYSRSWPSSRNTFALEQRSRQTDRHNFAELRDDPRLDIDGGGHPRSTTSKNGQTMSRDELLLFDEAGT